MTSVAPYRARLTRSARHWLAKFLEAELAGAALEATVWRAKHARNIPQSEELLQRRMIEREDQSHYVVSLLGLATASGALARSTLSHCERLFSALRRHYALDPKTPILAAEIAERIRLPGPQVLQSAKFLQRSPAYLSIHLGPDGPSLFPNEQYVTIKDFAALLDQARNQKDLTALQPLAFIGRIDQLIPATSEPASTPSLTKGHCPRCGPERQAIISSQHMETWEERSVSGSETYNILKCAGCGEVYFQRLSDCSEDRDYAYDEHGETISFARPKITYWPVPVVRPTPPWSGRLVDDILRNMLQEVYGALNADFRALAAIGARTVLDRAMALLQTPDAEGFIARLKDLVQRQLISPHEKDILGVLTDAGNASAHRGWRPTPENLATIMDGIENFLHRLFVLGAATDAMKAHVPPRPPRSKVSKPTP